MPHTTSFEPGDVVLTRFPFTDLSDVKQRPAVVLSSVEHQRTSRDVIVAAISGRRVDRPGPFDHIVRDWEAAGLLMPSVVRAGKVVTLERSTIARKLGTLADSELVTVRGMVRSVLS